MARDVWKVMIAYAKIRGRREHFFAENKEDLQQLLDILEESIKNALELNSKNTVVMIVSRNNECPQINIFINGN